MAGLSTAERATSSVSARYRCRPLYCEQSYFKNFILFFKFFHFLTCKTIFSSCKFFIVDMVLCFSNPRILNVEFS